MTKATEALRMALEDSPLWEDLLDELLEVVNTDIEGPMLLDLKSALLGAIHIYEIKSREENDAHLAYEEQLRRAGL